jgi:hypothetical protein
VEALTVVGEHLDDATISDPALGTFVYHVLHLGSQGHQPGDLVIDLGKMPPSYGVGIAARAVRVALEAE